MRILDDGELDRLLRFPELIDALQAAFQSENTETPLRHHHDFPGPETANTLLLMPAWQRGGFLGVKIVTVCPDNHRRALPTIQGAYLLFDAETGAPLLQTEAKTLTNWRTAAASALASRFLSRPGSEHLLLVGTGALVPFLARAHASVRPLRRITVWGRNPEKARIVAAQLTGLAAEVGAAEKLTDAIENADIISCATLSPDPLVRGEWLRPGQHLDLVGSFKPDTREADDEAVRRARVYVDTMEGALKETGDIALPIQNGILKPADIPGDLFALCRGECPGRKGPEEITIFKSVGHALEDLAAARLVYKKMAPP